MGTPWVTFRGCLASPGVVQRTSCRWARTAGIRSTPTVRLEREDGPSRAQVRGTRRVRRPPRITAQGVGADVAHFSRVAVPRNLQGRGTFRYGLHSIATFRRGRHPRSPGLATRLALTLCTSRTDVDQGQCRIGLSRPLADGDQPRPVGFQMVDSVNGPWPLLNVNVSKPPIISIMQVWNFINATSADLGHPPPNSRPQQQKEFPKKIILRTLTSRIGPFGSGEWGLERTAVGSPTPRASVTSRARSANRGEFSRHSTGRGRLQARSSATGVRSEIQIGLRGNREVIFGPFPRRPAGINLPERRSWPYQPDAPARVTVSPCHTMRKTLAGRRAGMGRQSRVFGGLGGGFQPPVGLIRLRPRQIREKWGFWSDRVRFAPRDRYPV